VGAILWIMVFVAVLLPPAPASASRSTAAAGSDQVTVPATRPWTDTGIAVANGAIVSFHATGEINIYGGRADSFKSPDGGPDCIASAARYAGQWAALGLPCWSLIGRIGSGAPFLVGSDSSYTAPAAGELYLGVNDESLASFNDNSGAWTVVITTSGA
jgi:hypothetical protein